MNEAEAICHPITEREPCNVHADSDEPALSSASEKEVAHIIPKTTSLPRQEGLDVSLCQTGAVAVFILDHDC